MSNHRRRHASNGIRPSNKPRLAPPLVRSLALGLMLVLLASACSVDPAPTVEQRSAATEAQLLADGTPHDIAACVVEVGRRELRRAPLSEAALDELLSNCRAAGSVINGSADGDGSGQPSGEADMDRALAELSNRSFVWTRGDDPVLDQLWDACEQGSGAACDELFAASPVGSQYEEFGVSCGDRADIMDCASLDEVEQPQ